MFTICALFYEMLPSQTLSITVKIYGKIKSKKRVIIVFCTNINGTDKHILSVIGHSRKPRCFNNVNHNAYVQYFHDKKAWMTSTIFNKWLENFDVHVGTNNKNMLLIFGNAPSHKSLYKLMNTTIIFLPPCTTSKLQPLDAGVIRTFKAYYKRNLFLFGFENFEKELKQKFSLKDVVKWSKECSNMITRAVKSQ